MVLFKPCKNVSLEFQFQWRDDDDDDDEYEDDYSNEDAFLI